ncbi:MAG: NHLP bacteriocin system secretion protein [Acidobacteriota bacterium]
MAGPPIFRTKALDRLSSPDRIDERIQVVKPSDWLPLLVAGALLLLALVWSVTGRVPTTVSGRGVLIYPRAVMDLQTLIAGRVEQLLLRTGDHVIEGQVVGTVDQFELRRRIDEDRVLLTELEAQDRIKGRTQTVETSRQQQQTALTKTYARSQAEALRGSLADARALQPLLDRRLTGVRAVRDAGLLAAAALEVVGAEQASLENARRITEVTAQIAQLEVQIAQSEGIETTLSRQHLDAGAARRAEIQRLKSVIAINELQVVKNSGIVAPHAGQVLEVLVANGHIAAAGERVATLQAENPQTTLLHVAYLAVGVGKRVRPGMRVQITPDGIERHRFGGITGTVTAVSALPVTADGVRATVGSAELANGLLGGESRVEITAALDREPANASGYHWSSSSGPTTPMTAGLTGDIRIIVEERAPITYVLPFLRELTGTR